MPLEWFDGYLLVSIKQWSDICNVSYKHLHAVCNTYMFIFSFKTNVWHSFFLNQHLLCTWANLWIFSLSVVWIVAQEMSLFNFQLVKKWKVCSPSEYVLELLAIPVTVNVVFSSLLFLNLHFCICSSTIYKNNS